MDAVVRDGAVVNDVVISGGGYGGGYVGEANDGEEIVMVVMT